MTTNASANVWRIGNNLTQKQTDREINLTPKGDGKDCESLRKNTNAGTTAKDFRRKGQGILRAEIRKSQQKQHCDRAAWYAGIKERNHKGADIISVEKKNENVRLLRLGDCGRVAEGLLKGCLSVADYPYFDSMKKEDDN